MDGVDPFVALKSRDRWIDAAAEPLRAFSWNVDWIGFFNFIFCAKKTKMKTQHSTQTTQTRICGPTHGVLSSFKKMKNVCIHV